MLDVWYKSRLSMSWRTPISESEFLVWKIEKDWVQIKIKQKAHFHFAVHFGTVAQTNGENVFGNVDLYKVMNCSQL